MRSSDAQQMLARPELMVAPFEWACRHHFEAKVSSVLMWRNCASASLQVLMEAYGQLIYEALNKPDEIEPEEAERLVLGALGQQMGLDGDALAVLVAETTPYRHLLAEAKVIGPGGWLLPKLREGNADQIQVALLMGKSLGAMQQVTGVAAQELLPRVSVKGETTVAYFGMIGRVVLGHMMPNFNAGSGDEEKRLACRLLGALVRSAFALHYFSSDNPLEQNLYRWSDAVLKHVEGLLGFELGVGEHSALYLAFEFGPEWGADLIPSSFFRVCRHLGAGLLYDDGNVLERSCEFIGRELMTAYGTDQGAMAQ